jgi:hypothetical protein
VRIQDTAVLLLASLAIGCGNDVGTAVECNYDSSRARVALTAALDAWKSGKARDLTRLKPPIRFGDDDQKAGLKLDAHRMTEPEAPIRPFTSVPVELTLRDMKGEPFKRRASYQVALEPGISVLRDD